MLSAVAVSAMPVSVDAVEPWITWFRAAGVTGCLIAALIYVFREGKARQARLEELVHQGNEAARLLAIATATKAEVDRANTQAMFQIAGVVQSMTESCQEIHNIHRNNAKVPVIKDPNRP